MSETTEAQSKLDAYGRACNDRPTDTSNRIMVPELSDRELAEETLATLRQIADVISQIGANPAGMMSRFMPGMGPVLAAVNQNKKG